MQKHRLFQTAIAVAITLGCAGFTAQPVRAQVAAPSKPAEEVYKNIVQLKGTPADQLMPAMQFISSSLGVQCDFCHVQGKMEADDKGAKKTAREMMAMQAAINKESFRGQLQVTCFSCHRGAQRPVNSPPVLESDAAPRPRRHPCRPRARRRRRDGRPDRRKICDCPRRRRRHQEGHQPRHERRDHGGRQRDADRAVHQGAQQARLDLNGQSYTAFDGTVGWMGNTGRPAREMSATEAEAAGLDAEFSLALRLKEIFPQLRRGRPETIAGVECETLNAGRPGKPAGSPVLR